VSFRAASLIGYLRQGRPVRSWDAIRHHQNLWRAKGLQPANFDFIHDFPVTALEQNLQTVTPILGADFHRLPEERLTLSWRAEHEQVQRFDKTTAAVAVPFPDRCHDAAFLRLAAWVARLALSKGTEVRQRTRGHSHFSQHLTQFTDSR